MKLAVLSGKGGTGKTLVSVNLAAVCGDCTYIDCDVEEPNGHLFFKPEKISETVVNVPIPQIDAALCTGCRTCVDFCRFGALAYTNDKVMVFSEICHSCGSCMLLCPQGAIAEKDKTVGAVQTGQSGAVKVRSGFLNPGEASGVPIIHKLLSAKSDNNSALQVIDCPPGSACTAMESIRDADYCILVAEPTLFGVHNLKMVYNLVKLFGKPHGTVLNKCTEDENPSEAFCIIHNIEILTRIPFDTTLGTLNANGHIAVRESEEYHALFDTLLERIRMEVHNATAVDS